MVTPLRVLLLLFYVACMTAVIMVLSPKEIEIGDGLTMNVFSTEDIWEKDTTTRQVDMSRFDDFANKVDSIEKITQKTGEVLVTTSTAQEDNSTVQKEKIEPVKDIKFPVQFPDSINPTHLDHFFESLRHIYNDKSLVRVIHYGDSQIEGDRISEYLRTRFQNKFGGCGVGLVPMLEKQAFRSTLTTSHASNWVRLAIYGNDAPKKRGASRFGLLGSAYRYSPKNKDSVVHAEKTYRSWVSFKETSIQTDIKNTQIENIKILYSSPTSKINTDIKIDKDAKKDTIINQSLGYANTFNIFEQNIPTKFKKLTINFESAEGAELYGVALDCNEGVAVDNVALRGSSGVEFTKIEKEFFRQQVKDMNVKLIILQFGVNVVPNVLSDYTFYENLFYQQLRYLKSLSPDIDILVVGVSDMSRKQGTRFVSYPNIEKIRDAQKRAAFKAGCAFWDLYQAMGGYNSMLSWVNNKPALGNKDFTHFTARGARVVGEMLYNALMKEYDNFKKRMGYEDKVQ
jgi:lysophospholipase L1-like esterase